VSASEHEIRKLDQRFQPPAGKLLGEPTVIYSRRPHAAHYAYDHPARGHDLEQWDVTQPFHHARPDGVPWDAEKHSGYVDDAGRAHTLFTRPAPLTGTCDRCIADAPPLFDVDTSGSRARIEGGSYLAIRGPRAWEKYRVDVDGLELFERYANADEAEAFDAVVRAVSP
jgi:hypothetical protein